MSEFDSLPTYAELRGRTDAPPGSSWGLFGAAQQRGMANFTSAADRVRAGELITEGAVFNLDYPLDAFIPALFEQRGAFHHEVFDFSVTAKDDYLDRFFLQGASQIDGLRHVRDVANGFYDGVSEASMVAGNPDLGIQIWAEDPVVGRAVLIDLERQRELEGRPIDHAAGEALEFDLIPAALTSQGIALRPGDIVLLHTGWANWYLSLDEAARADARERKVFTGLFPDRAVVAWVWDERVAFLGSDTVAVEVHPTPPYPPMYADSSPENNGRLHGHLLARLGLLLGELWKLSELAEHSRATGRWDALITIKPLNLTGGVGSPANAVAIR